MTLKQYLDQIGRAEWDSFAKRCGTTSGYIPQLYGGHRKPGVFLAINIEKASDGEVTRQELRPDVDWKRLSNHAA